MSRLNLQAEQVVLGLRDVRAKMLSLPRKVGTNIVRRGLLEGAGVIRDEARRLAPAREIRGGGRLRRSIVAQTRGVFRDAGGVPTEHRATVIIARKTTGGTRSVRAYAHFVEFGTAPHSLGKGSQRVDFVRKDVVVQAARQFGIQHPGAKPKPFLRPAFDAKKFEAVTVIAARIRRDIELEVSGVATGRRAAG